MLEHLKKLPDDPVLGVSAMFAADPRPDKVDLGVGVYKDAAGEAPIMRAVKQAERLRLETERSKAYLGITGDPGFTAALESLVLGDGAAVLRDGRVRSLQTPGSCAALHAAAALIARANGAATAWVSDPTWANHVPVFRHAGLRVAEYPYYDRVRRSIRFEAMLNILERAAPGDVVVLHGCCHNPSGADLTPPQWLELVGVLERRRLLPLLDLAYQGFGQGLEADAEAVRLLVERLPEALVAVSCSKNFGLYRDRVGMLTVVAGGRAQAEAAQSQLSSIARCSYSMPPAHGAALVRSILEEPALTKDWRDELEAMRSRMEQVRRALSHRLASRVAGYGYLGEQRGMFSFLPLAAEQIEVLRRRFGIYLLESGRINVSGLNDANVDYVAEAVAAVDDSST